MGLWGLAARAALLKEQLKQRPCVRCGLHYDHVKAATCPHCGDLDERGLARLQERRETGFRANRQLGTKFFIATMIIVFIMVVVLAN